MNEQIRALHAYILTLLEGRSGAPSPDTYDVSLRPLAEALCALEKGLAASSAYATALASGNLSYVPESDTQLCLPLNALHTNLNRLVWQIKRVADGERAHQETFLPALSEALGTLTAKIAQSEEALRAETEARLEKERMARESDELLTTLTNSLSLGIVAIDVQSHEVVFTNDKGDFLLHAEYPSCAGCPDRGDLARSIIQYNAPPEKASSWELSCPRNGLHYRVNTHLVVLRGRQTYAHVLEDISRQMAHTSALAQHVYRDELTGLYNRRYCIEQMREFLASDSFFTICYLDIDNLKFVNDVFGHLEGDEYIKLIVDTIRRSIRSADIFGRLGGDEFMILFRNTPAFIVNGKFQTLTAAIRAMSHTSKPYDTSISYGVMEVAADDRRSVEALLKSVDDMMYAYKRTNKPKIDYPAVR